METKGKVFLLESPNALDLLQERGERSSLEHICKLFGHDVTSFLLRSQAELEQTLIYLSAIWRHPAAGDDPLFIHISTHGDSDGIGVGADDISWDNLTLLILKTYKNLDKYRGPIVLILSACGAKYQGITSRITRQHQNGSIDWPPEYIFVFSDEIVDWRDAVVTWTIFYREATSLDFGAVDEGEIGKVQQLLNRLKKTDAGTLTYFRWDNEDNKYKRYKA